jgi:uncharacterized protein
MDELLVSSFMVGLLGSLHCAGMCGPLAAAVACGRPENPPAGRIAAFLGGKLVTYALLGIIAGVLGSAFGAGRLGARPFAVLGLVAGVLMVSIGVRTIWRRVKPLTRIGTRPPGPLATLLSAALRGRSQAAPFLTGALAGLLPCGLVWAMAARSLTAGPPLAGALVMTAFGLGTSPSLAAAGWVSRAASGRARRWGEFAAAAAVVVMGLVCLWRGANALLMPACPLCHGA